MKTENTRADRILDFLGWILLIGTLAYLILGWSSFPDQIPMHYNGAGEIDRWGGKGEIIFIEVMMWILYLGIGVVEKYPQIWNTGVEVTAKNKEKVYRTLKYMLKTLKFLTALIFAYLIVNSLQSAPLPGWFTPAVMILVFGDMAFWLLRLFRIKK
ncbi:DUF1648 domain-containing protein [Mediterraneibacter glycyrrhizinilyticus]|uniref:DUF1648 domain-containing protein n=1 Tax=Mediterraneibacter glycyrrhizinilyticus TaxID=342942 RepID=UPI001961CEE5|nr:DUF1648 domain-containing protein [Mediterraneibacter glycyrrhizinilyticus]MBM6753108.1 DUF1648 domain-containing protein [Mediterraneibacter glycyrrhizinilyticus]